MAYVLIMPRQGNTVESCIIGEWKVKEGDAVKADTPVCVVETDKATFEIPAGADGSVLKIIHPEGDDVPVLLPIMVVGSPGENWEAALPAGTAPAAKAEKPAEDVPAKAAAVKADTPAAPVSAAASGGAAAVSPRAKKLAYEEAVNPADIGAGSGPGGRVIEQDIAAYLEKRPPLTAAAKDELRKRIAAGLAANLPAEGSGIGGRVTAAEIGAAASAAAGGAAESAGYAGGTIADEFVDTPIKGIRKIIADQMMKSHTTTAAFTLNSAAPAVKLQELRGRFKASAPELGMSKITINDLVLFAASRVLPLYSYMNAHKTGETIRTWKNVHLGVAVSTPRGLMVPVIRNADRLTLAGISRRAKELAEACRNGSVAPDDIHGSTFTVSNLGNTGIDSFSPVINIPEVAILGVCGISPRPVEISAGRYETLPHIGLSLTIDHAVVDGAPAAEFLKALAGAIRDIDIWLGK